MGCGTCDSEGVVCSCKSPSVWCDKSHCAVRRCPTCKGDSTTLVRDIVGFRTASASADRPEAVNDEGGV